MSYTGFRHLLFFILVTACCETSPFSVSDSLAQQELLKRTRNNTLNAAEEISLARKRKQRKLPKSELDYFRGEWTGLFLAGGENSSFDIQFKGRSKLQKSIDRSVGKRRKRKDSYVISVDGVIFGKGQTQLRVNKTDISGTFVLKGSDNPFADRLPSKSKFEATLVTSGLNAYSQIIGTFFNSDRSIVRNFALTRKATNIPRARYGLQLTGKKTVKAGENFEVTATFRNLGPDFVPLGSLDGAVVSLGFTFPTDVERFGRYIEQSNLECTFDPQENFDNPDTVTQIACALPTSAETDGKVVFEVLVPESLVGKKLSIAAEIISSQGLVEIPDELRTLTVKVKKGDGSTNDGDDSTDDDSGSDDSGSGDDGNQDTAPIQCLSSVMVSHPDIGDRTLFLEERTVTGPASSNGLTTIKCDYMRDSNDPAGRTGNHSIQYFFTLRRNLNSPAIACKPIDSTATFHSLSNQLRVVVSGSNYPSDFRASTGANELSKWESVVAPCP